jgi:hypothetical protein
MANLLVTDSFNRTVRLGEVRDRLAQIDIRDALAHVTKLASRQLWFPETQQVASKINLINLSLLAKAVVLYASPNGRPLDLSNTESNDLVWLLKALNSMQWWSRTEIEQNHAPTLISGLMRQAYVRNFVGDHPVNVIARAYTMFYERLPQASAHRVDLDAALQQTVGVSRRDLWILCSAIYVFYFLECAKEDGPWMIRPDFFVDAPERHELERVLRTTLASVSRTPQEIRDLYQQNAKYHSDRLPEEYWLSEFNVLRDFPIIKLGDDQYCCPFPVFAWMRGSVGYYFDLVTHFAEIERRNNRRNPNPFDNVMGQVLGDMFQDYVGLHLAELAEARHHLLAEYEYQSSGETLRSPDWLLRRVPGLPVLFECKARRPSLAMQTRCNETDREAEVRSVLSRALGQLTVFLNNAEAGRTAPFEFGGGARCVYALVLYDSFPFHALPDIRNQIERLAVAIDPDWTRFRDRVLFVPLSIQELELACLVEQRRGVLLEDQLRDYARYRGSAPRLRNNVLARHFYEYAIERWPLGGEAITRLCRAKWDSYCDMMYRTLYGEELADHEARRRTRWIAEAAYFRWLNAASRHGHDVEDWLEAERLFEELTARFGMPPYQEKSLRSLHEIRNKFV